MQNAVINIVSTLTGQAKLEQRKRVASAIVDSVNASGIQATARANSNDIFRGVVRITLAKDTSERVASTLVNRLVSAVDLGADADTATLEPRLGTFETPMYEAAVIEIDTALTGQDGLELYERVTRLVYDSVNASENGATAQLPHNGDIFAGKVRIKLERPVNDLAGCKQVNALIKAVDLGAERYNAQLKGSLRPRLTNRA